MYPNFACADVKQLNLIQQVGNHEKIVENNSGGFSAFEPFKQSYSKNNHGPKNSDRCIKYRFVLNFFVGMWNSRSKVSCEIEIEERFFFGQAMLCFKRIVPIVFSNPCK